MKKMTMKDGKKIVGNGYATMHIPKKVAKKGNGAVKKAKIKY